MGPAILFFIVLVAAGAAPLLLVVQSLDYYSMAEHSTAWINNDAFFEGRYYGRNIFTRVQHQAHSGIAPFIAAGFYCVSSFLSPCDEFLFAVSIDTSIDTVDSIHSAQIVWSANRARPVRENATLELTTGGNLVLRDDDGSHVWTSNSSGRSVQGMKLTEVGNLVLFDHRNATVWQSFDHPTDTMVPGQSLLDGMRLASNTSLTNWTDNRFCITILPDGLNAYYAESTPPQLYFRYSLLTGKTGKHRTKITLMDGSLRFMLGPDMNEDIRLPVAQSTQYMRLDSDGYLRLYEWSSYSQSWTIAYDILGKMKIGMHVCDYPTVCGEYGICTEGQCGCPLENNSSSSYFKLVDERKPNLGCAPVTPISCQEIQHHQLLSIPGISYFDNTHTAVNATTADDCKQACLKNCSCMAVWFRYNDKVSSKECVWVTKVLSMQSIQAETIGYLKVQLNPSNENKTKLQIKPSNKNKNKVMFGATLGAVTTLVLLAIVVALYLERRRKYGEKDEEFDFDHLSRMPTRYSFQKLSQCTEGFSRKLGEGGFGSVFEGKLGEERIAVKRLEGARQGKKEFFAEVETIGSIEHINLVRLIGFCVGKSERLLVYEYMSRGSLDRWIYYNHNNAPLDWCTRCRIIMGIAKGLCYLHEDCNRKIAHLDIKPQNILLDDSFNAKVADFGLCKLINRDQSKVVTLMRGTPGYLAPEWLTSPITEKVDVYSFGVVIMEIISGRKNIDSSQPEEDVHLIKLLQEKEKNKHLIDLIDKHSDDMVSHKEEVIRMMKLAVWCLQNDCTRRPSMSTVIKVLEGATHIETFEANSIMFVQDNPSTYSASSQASILSGPR